jgi:AAA15 family ATPase/GTPase
MLLRFSAQNFRSLRDEQELSLIAGNLSDQPELIRHPPGIPDGVLPSAVIYGANASGKSNVLLALRFMEHAVTESQRSWKPETRIGIEPFLLGPENARSMTFRIDVLIDGVRYEYGFELDSEQILREWLNAYPSGRKQTWLVRDVAARPVFRFGKHLAGENRTIENLTRKNSLFLSAAAQNNHEQLLRIYSWFSQKLWFINATGRVGSLVTRTAELCSDSKLRERITTLMASADLGIVGIDITEEPITDQMKIIMDALVKVFPDGAPKPEEITAGIPKLLLRHQSAGTTPVSFENDAESRGTLAWLGLLGHILQALEKGRTLCVDELDSSLHPVLAAQLVKFFNSPETNPNGAQLVFNTHDTNLLDLNLFRRDQIWFTEKDKEGATHLYPLSDFHPRLQENLERGYLQGRYGAIPFLGALNPGPSPTDRE